MPPEIRPVIRLKYDRNTVGNAEIRDAAGNTAGEWYDGVSTFRKWAPLVLLVSPAEPSGSGRCVSESVLGYMYDDGCTSTTHYYICEYTAGLPGT